MPAKSISKAIKRFGTDSPDARRRELRAGALTATLDNGALRHIRYHGMEVLRGIAFLVRDKDWGTYTPSINGLKVKQSASGFAVSYTAICEDAAQSISYTAKIEARADGHIQFSATGLPKTDFLTNRTGFVVLHPLDGVVGAPVEIVHTDGAKEKSRFPKVISPGQPVFEIRSLKHTVMPGVTATVLMEGDKFEMEDHRNWMDASYKTYVCSLLDPWPYTLKANQGFTQCITLTLEGRPKQKTGSRPAKSIALSVGGAAGVMPSFGVAVPMDEAVHSLAAADLVAALKPDHLVCQLDGRKPHLSDAARSFHDLSRKVNAPVTLEVILPAKDDASAEMGVIADAVRNSRLKPSAVVVTQTHDLKSFQPNTPRPWGPGYGDMAAAARQHFPGAKIGGGMLSYFTELNRKPVPQGLFDFVTHTVCPIVHAADDVSVMETLEALPSIFASTRKMMGKLPYHLGPSGIPCRDNPYGATVAANPHNARVCLSDLDPRQRGLFAAAWNVGLATAAAKARLEAVTLGAATGPQGVIHRPLPQPQPGFDDHGLKLFPAYAVLRALFSSVGGRIVTATSTDETRLATVSWSKDRQTFTLAANLTDGAIAVKLNSGSPAIRLSILDDSSFLRVARDGLGLDAMLQSHRRSSPVDLSAYAVALIAW